MLGRRTVRGPADLRWTGSDVPVTSHPEHRLFLRRVRHEHRNRTTSGSLTTKVELSFPAVPVPGGRVGERSPRSPLRPYRYGSARHRVPDGLRVRSVEVMCPSGPAPPPRS